MNQPQGKHRRQNQLDGETRSIITRGTVGRALEDKILKDVESSGDFWLVSLTRTKASRYKTALASV